MNVIYDIATVRMSEVSTHRIEVPRWEIPVLQAIHGNDLQVVGNVVVKRAIPEPSDEFQRLATRYGPKNEKTPAVAAVFGNFGPGTAALRNAIRDSLTDEGVTPSTYRSPDERKADAAAASKEGTSIEAEARALKSVPAVVIDPILAAKPILPAAAAPVNAPVGELKPNDETIVETIVETKLDGKDESLAALIG